MKPYSERLADAQAMTAMAKERMKKPVLDSRQKFLAGTEVYVRPIYEGSMLHFTCDLITRVRGTYAQLYGGSNDRNFRDYALDVSSWYDEDQLMPTEGRSIQECHAHCLEYFGKSYDELCQLRETGQDNCPLRKACKEIADKVFSEIVGTRAL